jgi:hypothetical protein
VSTFTVFVLTYQPRSLRLPATAISGDDLAQILGIELRRQRRRADQVSEHYRQPGFRPWARATGLSGTGPISRRNVAIAASSLRRCRRVSRRGSLARRRSAPAIPRHRWRCRKTPARITAAPRPRNHATRSTLASSTRPLPRRFIVRQIVPAGEYSARLVAPQGHAVHHTAIAVVTALLAREHYAVATPSPEADPVLVHPRNVGLGSPVGLPTACSYAGIGLDSGHPTATLTQCAATGADPDSRALSSVTVRSGLCFLLPL